ncbi:hypothetical protein SAMN05192558_10587 [Actinokineospora alba]|uniref:Uncharacterized protein n=1 Tax=Actinokineospora alba TaxID=504798 RepID=A0A1H0MWL5_9PSEU|nr:hypothetical protein [Actinokineospora alba]TDP68460.1 hypothetical protein C8E96_4025 [Actinokineospora alba]SDH79525.1 hypothetical protein SAMN05421871_102137 [Actinokineospora alba]SDO84676.1 hypothetical protein SAMN05192558_10587 [Actinokineospora alba]
MAPHREAADERVEQVRDDAAGRFRLAREFYRTPGRRGFARGELSFLRWEFERGVLSPVRGSPWWRAVNERLLRDKIEADLARGGQVSSRAVELWTDFVRGPTPVTWYRAHNASVVAGYLEHEELAHDETPLERFMINVTLVRALYAHALVAEPRLAAGRLGRAARHLGDPRYGTVGLFLSLRRVFPQHYPVVGGSLARLLAEEGSLPRLLDFGVILPRLEQLYGFAAKSLDEPRITELITDGIPSYGQAPVEPSAWTVNRPSLTMRLVRQATKPVADSR